MWIDVGPSVGLYLFVTFLVTVGTLHRLLSVRIVVDQELQQAVLWWEGAVPFHYGWVTVAKTHIQTAWVICWEKIMTFIPSLVILASICILQVELFVLLINPDVWASLCRLLYVQKPPVHTVKLLKFETASIPVNLPSNISRTPQGNHRSQVWETDESSYICI